MDDLAGTLQQCQIVDDKSEVSAEVQAALNHQKSRGYLSEFRQSKLEEDAARNWDRFYKRNETRFFKDRHWTLREFQDLLPTRDFSRKQLVLFEVGCGVGNFIYPLLEDRRDVDDADDLLIHACDFSERAVEFVRADSRYSSSRINAFVMDIVCDRATEHVSAGSVDVASLIFVLSSVRPDRHAAAVENLRSVVRRPDGVVLFRDYGRHDVAQLRFKPGHLITDNFYVKQDGTRVYYFTVEDVIALFTNAGFTTVSCGYVTRQTINKKEGIDVQRTFVQGKFVLR